MMPLSFLLKQPIAAVLAWLRRRLAADEDPGECCGIPAGIMAAAGSWRLAESLKALRADVDAAAPGRRKASDGTVGDARHAARTSDHNPWVRDGRTGVVTAIDITHDPLGGCDAGKLADALVAARDPRVKYIIWNRRIANSAGVAGRKPWTWRSYSGTNPHTSHVHISVLPQKALYDDRRPWPLPGRQEAEPPKPVLRPIAWGRKVDPAFRAALIAICGRLKLEPDFLMAVIAFETGRSFRPDTVNKASGATGLIQFMPKTAKALGTSTAALAGMSAVAQLAYVEAYLKPFTSRLDRLSDVYMAVLWPAAVGKGETHVLFAEPSKAYRLNSGLDRNRDGKVTKAEASARIEAELALGRRPENLG